MQAHGLPITGNRTLHFRDIGILLHTRRSSAPEHYSWPQRGPGLHPRVETSLSPFGSVCSSPLFAFYLPLLPALLPFFTPIASRTPGQSANRYPQPNWESSFQWIVGSHVSPRSGAQHLRQKGPKCARRVGDFSPAFPPQYFDD